LIGASRVLRLLAIAGGGAAGAVARYWVSGRVYQWLGTDFPWGTLVVNVAGSFLIGLLATVLLERLPLDVEWRALLIIGFLGAFTTFSTFSWETLALIEQAQYAKAVGNALVSVVACLAATWLGVVAGRAL
jgi:CrcB protein